MRIHWFGQSAFLLSGDAGRVMIDPFADVSGLRSRVKFDYPEIAGVEAALVLITHVEELGPRWVVPMHHRTPAIGFLEPADEFLDAFPPDRVHRIDQAVFDLPDRGSAEPGPVVFVPAAPGG